MGWQGQLKKLVFMDCPAPLLKDKFMAVANHAMAEWQRKTKEFERKKKQQKQ